jgi:hypothetical protein
VARFSIEVSGEALMAIQQVRKELDLKSPAQVLQKALNLFVFVQKKRAAGCKVVVVSADDKTAEEIIQL